jgi:hypothetical protein
LIFYCFCYILNNDETKEAQMVVCGRIIRGGARNNVDGEKLCGIFIEMAGRELFKVGKLGLFNQRVIIHADRRIKNLSVAGHMERRCHVE